MAASISGKPILNSTRQPPLVEGDFYEGAFGPSILLVLRTKEAVLWLRSVFEDLAGVDVGHVFRLEDQAQVEIGAAVTEFLMRRVERTPERHLVRSRQGGFTWSCTAKEWRAASLLLEPLLSQSGHQYLTSETDDDAIIEVSRGEEHG